MIKLINLNLISKETSQAEHEYMNKHPPINVLATAVAILQYKWSKGRKIDRKKA